MEKSNDVFVRDSMRRPSRGGDAECGICSCVMWCFLTLIQLDKLTDCMFSFKAMAWRSGGMLTRGRSVKHILAYI